MTTPGPNRPPGPGPMPPDGDDTDTINPAE